MTQTTQTKGRPLGTQGEGGRLWGKGQASEDTETTDFWPRELRENYVCCLRQPACGICYGSPRKLRQRCSSVTPREPQEGTRDGVFSDHASTLTTFSPGKVSFPSHTGPPPHADHMSVWCAPRVSEISRLTTYSPSQFWTSPLFHVWF